MRLRGDDRAVTVQIGAILLFGILIIALASYQAAVVPSANEQVEFQHNQQAQSQMQDVRDSVVRSASTGSTQSASVRMGTQYPSRTLFVNPPPAAGTIRTDGTNNDTVAIVVRNATVPDGGATLAQDDAQDYWDGTDRSYDTGLIAYDVDYNEYENAPTVIYEHTLLYNKVGDRTSVRRTGQTFIDGKQIDLVALTGDLEKSGVGSESIDARGLSASDTEVLLTSVSASEPITISIPTKASNETWSALLRPERDDGFVASWNHSWADGPGEYAMLNVTLEAGQEYEFRGALVGVGAVQQSATPNATYVVRKSEFEEIKNNSVDTGSVTVQIRDEFNNPVSGKQVNATASNVTLINSEATTDDEGLATFEYEAQTQTDDAELNISINEASEDYEFVTYDNGSVESAAGGEGNLNPSGAGNVVLVNETSPSQDTVRVWFNNTGNETLNISKARINFYFTDQNKDYEEADVYYTDDSQISATLVLGEDFKVLSPEIELQSDQLTDFKIQFRQTDNEGNLDVATSDFFVITIVFDNGDSATYFVSP